MLFALYIIGSVVIYTAIGLFVGPLLVDVLCRSSIVDEYRLTITANEKYVSRIEFREILLNRSYWTWGILAISCSVLLLIDLITWWNDRTNR